MYVYKIIFIIFVAQNIKIYIYISFAAVTE